MVLRALSFLPVKRLHLLHNPCSAVRAYRFCVIQQLPGLEALDGAPVRTSPPPDDDARAAADSGTPSSPPRRSPRMRW